ncbi:MAG: hypothetical protein QM820_43895 [Minicystis sp.]
MSFGLAPFQVASRELGLTLQEASSTLRGDAHALSGVLEGQRVSIRLWRGDWVWVEFEAPFDPPGDLHLHIAQAGVLSRAKALFGKHDIEVGDAAFDAAFEIKAHEPERALALLAPDLRAVLFPWKDAGHLFHVDDQGVHLSVRTGTFYSEPDAALIVQNGRAAAHLGRAFAQALARVPPSRVLGAHVEAWRAFADAHALDLQATPLRMSGALTRASYRGGDAVPFAARVVSIGKDEYGVELRVRVDLEPPFLLRVRPAHWYDFAVRRYEATGDEAFDAALRVTTDDPEAAKRALRESVRSALLSLHAEHAAVALEDGELSIRTKAMIEPAAFGEIVDRLATVAREMRFAA